MDRAEYSQGRFGWLREMDETFWPLGRSSIVDPGDLAREIVGEGWKFKDFDRIAFHNEISWSDLATADRSWAFHLHSWVFMEPVLRVWNAGGSDDLLGWALRVGGSWLRWVEHEGSSSRAAWYDMAIALRSTMLFELARSAAKAERFESEVEKFLEGAADHVRRLVDPAMYNPRTNHGYFTAIAQVVVGGALGDYTHMGDVVTLGAARLAEMVDSQFFPDGGHAEHSPEYHLLLLDSFSEAMTSGHLRGIVDEERLKAAAKVLGWMVQPDGKLAQFGDTSASVVVGADRGYADPASQYVMSDGREGHAPVGNLLALPDAGYAFARVPQVGSRVSNGEAGYLALQAGFHSRAHKHADDLTLLWFDRGREILVDGGKYGYGELLDRESPLRKQGYYYRSPERQYVESTAAHNTITLDGNDHDRRRAPTGSGLLACEMSALGVELNGRAIHGDWTHLRRISWAPGSLLLIHDEIVCGESAHHARGWLNFAGSLDVSALDDRWLAVTCSEWEVPLWVQVPTGSRIENVVKGRSSPLLGWRSEADLSLAPVWSVSWIADIERAFSGTTVLAFARSAVAASYAASRYSRLARG